jgi:hypothetical protein
MFFFSMQPLRCVRLCPNAFFCFELAQKVYRVSEYQNR